MNATQESRQGGARPIAARIVATLGPASESSEVVAKLILAGITVFRLNFSHGEFAAHLARLQTVRNVAHRLGRPTAVMGDLQGPKIRVGKVAAPGLMLEAGQDVVFRVDMKEAAVEKGVVVLPTTYAAMVGEVAPGQRVLINDGAIRMLALEADLGRGELRARVTNGGLVTSGKGINLPESDVKAPAITERDWVCVEWAVENGLDFLALSFVREASEVLELKERLSGMCSVRYDVDKSGQGASIPVIAKIEKPQAVANLDSIVQAADAVMVARGDLGVEMDIAKVPVVQHRILAACGQWGKPCIVATQMLETMTENASPTRAEASDVANAIFDGADAVMLSGETAVGKHPVLVVETMRRIIEAAEEQVLSEFRDAKPPTRMIEQRYRTAALAHGAWYLARDLQAKAIVCWSESGGSARYLSQTGFAVPILAYSSSGRSTRRMGLLRGVTAIECKPPPTGRLGDWATLVEKDLLARGWVKPGDSVILMAGKPLGVARVVDSMAVMTIGDPTSGFRA
ncbi:MAG: pyruvate kinase [Phycisphaeraceae bacterium]|nr:pyruvate kinase [Phycisphaeraceae bacterium]